MRKSMLTLSTVLSLVLFAGCGSSSEPKVAESNKTFAVEEKELDTLATTFFGDKENNRIIVADTDEMKLIDLVDDLKTGHQITYTADKVPGHTKAYVVNRGSNAIDVVDTQKFQIVKTIALDHFPRSAEAMNKTLGLCEVSGMNKAMATIIDTKTDEVVAVVGEDIEVDPKKNQNHGGSHATGHPYWLDSNHFVLLDRYGRKIITYEITKDYQDSWIVTKINELQTPTSIHQLIPRKKSYKGDASLYYATSEGSDELKPAVLELKFTKCGLEINRAVTLEKDGLSAKEMGIHHGDFHPSKKEIYIGSKEGNLFVVDYENMKIVKTIQAGKSAGHTMFVPKRNLAIVVNHKDTFVTIIDTNSDEKIKDVKVSNAEELVGNSTIQAHPKYYVSKDGRYFYAFITSDGLLYEMDLETLRVTRTLEVGGKPAQGSFVE